MVSVEGGGEACCGGCGGEREGCEMLMNVERRGARPANGASLPLPTTEHHYQRTGGGGGGERKMPGILTLQCAHTKVTGKEREWK